MTPIYKVSKIRKREIIEASRRIIATRGMKDLTVREVARGVGISEGDVYRHFQSKKDILFVLMDDIELTLLDDIRESVSPDRSTLDNLKEILEAHIDESEQMRGVSFIVIAETMRLKDEDLRVRMFEVVTNYLNNISDIIKEGIQAGAIRNDIDPDAAALMFFSLVQSIVTMWSLSGYSFNPSDKIAPIWKEYRAGIAIK